MLRTATSMQPEVWHRILGIQMRDSIQMLERISMEVSDNWVLRRTYVDKKQRECLCFIGSTTAFGKYPNAESIW